MDPHLFPTTFNLTPPSRRTFLSTSPSLNLRSLPFPLTTQVSTSYASLYHPSPNKKIELSNSVFIHPDLPECCNTLKVHLLSVSDLNFRSDSLSNTRVFRVQTLSLSLTSVSLSTNPRTNKTASMSGFSLSRQDESLLLGTVVDHILTSDRNPVICHLNIVEPSITHQGLQRCEGPCFLNHHSLSRPTLRPLTYIVNPF